MDKSYLDEIVDSLEIVSTDIDAYFDTHTGEVAMVTEMERNLANLSNEDDNDETPDYQERSTIKLKQILENQERFLKLPDSFEIHEWNIMKEFAESLEDSKLKSKLSNSLHGSGAFRQFKSLLAECNLLDEWFKFRREHLKEIALEWCEENGIKFAS